MRLFTFSKWWDGTSNTEAICTCTQTVQQRGWKVKNLPGIKGVNFCNSVSIHMTSRGLKLKRNKSNDWFISFFHLLCFQNHSNKNSHITCIYMYWNAWIWVLKVKKFKLKIMHVLLNMKDTLFLSWLLKLPDLTNQNYKLILNVQCV